MLKAKNDILKKPEGFHFIDKYFMINCVKIVKIVLRPDSKPVAILLFKSERRESVEKFCLSSD